MCVLAIVRIWNQWFKMNQIESLSIQNVLFLSWNVKITDCCDCCFVYFTLINLKRNFIRSLVHWMTSLLSFLLGSLLLLVNISDDFFLLLVSFSLSIEPIQHLTMFTNDIRNSKKFDIHIAHVSSSLEPYQQKRDRD